MRKLLSYFFATTICALLCLTVYAADLGGDVRVCDNSDILTDDTELFINNLNTGNDATIYVYTSSSSAVCQDESITISNNADLGAYDALLLINTSQGDYCLTLGTALSAQLTQDEITSLVSEDFEPLFSEGKIDEALTTFCTALGTKLGTLELTPQTDESAKSSPMSVVIVIFIVAVSLVLIVGAVIFIIRQHNIRRARRRRRQAMLIPKDQISRGPARKVDFDINVDVDD